MMNQKQEVNAFNAITKAEDDYVAKQKEENPNLPHLTEIRIRHAFGVAADHFYRVAFEAGYEAHKADVLKVLGVIQESPNS